MSEQSKDMNRRVLLVDDEDVLHKAYRKVLGATAAGDDELDDLEAEMFGDAGGSGPAVTFELDSALQGQEGLEMVKAAVRDKRPYAMAFVDMRMPPGWDGLETIERFWQVDPDIQIVICSAYSDYAWEDVTAKLGHSDRLLILKKPFDNIEVHQMACALTEKWNLARAARQQMGRLEEAVRQRTGALEQQTKELEATLEELKKTQSQLLQADKMASIGQLAAGVAHEINNPIGFISSNLNSLNEYVRDIQKVMSSYGQLLEAAENTPSDLGSQVDTVKKLRSEVDLDYLLSDLSDLVNESVEGTDRVRRIVADLRDFSHIDTGDAAIENVNEVIEKTISVASNELKYTAEIVRRFGQVPSIPCYGGKLGQVFLNLLVNAAQAIGEKGVITIRTGCENQQVWIEIQDTGCGIAPADLDRVFEPFFTTKEVGKGTGLGLNLVYNIIQEHKGDISVTSEVGVGTVFRILLPVTGPDGDEPFGNAAGGSLSEPEKQEANGS